MSAPPSVSTRDSPPIVAVQSSIDPYTEPRDGDGDERMAEDDVKHDAPGPSSTFVPRSPSPPLPDFSRSFADGADSDDDGDEVVATLPVYLSPALFGALHVFQYPLQHRPVRVPTWAADRGKRVATRVKEKVGRVEVEVPVDMGANVWRDERARELGFVTVRDGNGAVEGGTSRSKKGAAAQQQPPQKWGDKQRLRSEVVPVATGTSYYSGLVHDGALHLHPISKTMQFRTALDYVDDFDASNKSRVRGGGDDDDEAERGKRKAPGRPALAALGGPGSKILDDPANDGSGSIKDFRNKMWSTAQREEDDEWVAYEWHDDAEDEQVLASLESLLVHEAKRERLECKTRGLDYLDREHA